jgi:hypothetical protein
LSCLQWMPKVSLQRIYDSLSKLNYLHQISIRRQNCVVCNELTFATKIVLSVANQHPLLKVCCLQRMCDSISVVNQHLLPKVCVLQWICDLLLKLSCLQRIIIPCWKFIGCSELVFAAEVVLSVANQCSLLKVCCLQLICDSLLKLSCLQWISVHYQKCVFRSEFLIRCRNWVVYSELAFAAKSVLAGANQRSLLKLCCLQWISVRSQKCVVYNEFVIRCQKWVACSELAFITESVLAAAK